MASHTRPHAGAHLALAQFRPRSHRGGRFYHDTAGVGLCGGYAEAGVAWPPAYFTPDWEAAERSVQKLAELTPELVVTGHGRAMQGPEMQVALQNLARNFQEIAVPKEGRYVVDPATPSDGSAYRESD